MAGSSRKYVMEAGIIIQASSVDVKKAISATDELAEKVKDLDREYKENVASQDIVRRSLEKLKKEGRETGDEFALLHKDLERLDANLEKAEKASKDFHAAMEAAGDATNEQKDEAGRLAEALDKATHEQNDLNEEVREGKRAMENHEEALRQDAVATERLKIQTSELNVDLQAEKTLAIQLAIAEKRAARETRKWGVETGKLKEALVTGLAVGGVAGAVFKGISLIQEGFQRATEAVKEFHRASIETFSELEEEIARTIAQTPDLVTSQKELYDQVRTTSRQINRGTVETQTAIRKMLNLGLDETQALAAVTEASKAAMVANTGVAETAIAAMSAVNAYGKGIYTVGEVLDQYANITQNSNLETDDLVSGMAKIISPAAEAGVMLEEVGAAMIVMSRQGDDFNEIADLLGNLLTQIAVRGTTAGTAFEKAAGKGFREFTAAGGTLTEGLVLLEKEAARTGQSMSELIQGNSKFYRDMLAGRGALELTGRHTRELAEAYEAAQVAQGSLDQQTQAFTGSMYELDLALISARDNAYASEGSIAKGWNTLWTRMKTSMYDFSAQATDTIALYEQASEIVRFSREYGKVETFGMADVVALARRGVDFTTDINAGMLEYKKRMDRILLITKMQRGISWQDLQINMQRTDEYEKQRAEAEAKAVVTKRIYDDTVALGRAINDARQAEGEDGFMSQAEIAEAAAEVEKVRISTVAAADAVLAMNKSWEKFQSRLNAAYQQTLGIVNNLMDLNAQLLEAEDQEAIDDLTAQVEELNEATKLTMQQGFINSIIAADGYTDSVIDLAVEMGLLTQEMGDYQKEMIHLLTEQEKLAEDPKFDNLSILERAEAYELLASGIARSHEEAIGYATSEGWKDLMEPGERRWNEDQFVTPDSTDFQTLEDYRTEIEWLTGETFYVELDDNAEEMNNSMINLGAITTKHFRDRTRVLTTVYKTVGSPGAGAGGRFAGGGSFMVPPGYDSDNYMVGVSSGERVAVTSAGETASGGGGRVSLSVVNHFAPGVHDQAGVAKSSREALYNALEEAGLT